MNGWLVTAISALSLALGAVIAGWVAHIKAGQRERERQRRDRDITIEGWWLETEAARQKRQEATEKIREEVEQMDPDELAAAVDAGIDQFRAGRVGTRAAGPDSTGHPAE